MAACFGSRPPEQARGQQVKCNGGEAEANTRVGEWAAGWEGAEEKEDWIGDAVCWLCLAVD